MSRSIGYYEFLCACVCVLLCYYANICRSHNQVIANNIMNNNNTCTCTCTPCRNTCIHRNTCICHVHVHITGRHYMLLCDAVLVYVLIVTLCWYVCARLVEVSTTSMCDSLIRYGSLVYLYLYLCYDNVFLLYSIHILQYCALY